MQSTRDAVVTIIQEMCHPNVPDLSDDKRALVESKMDSLDWASSLMAIEDRYGLEISEDDLPELVTLRAIVDYVDNAVNK